MPSQEISRDELSNLLMVYLGMGSDIMELLVLFEEDYVLVDDIAIYATLVVWTVSLLQFTVVLTTTSKGKKSADMEDQSDGNAPSKCTCCASDIWSICLTMFMQDGPFLALRLYIIVKNRTLSYTILFFTLKNLLMLMIQTYRLFVVGCCHKDSNRNETKQKNTKTLKELKTVNQQSKINGTKEQQTDEKHSSDVIPHFLFRQSLNEPGTGTSIMQKYG